MTRLLGLFGFTGGFLIISASLRETLLDLANSGLIFVQAHSPYSYAGIVLVVFGLVTITLVSGSNPR